MQITRKLKALINTPRYVAGMWRVRRAAESRDWAAVAETIENLHDRKLVTDMSRHWLGIAYLRLERWGDALEQYDSIEDRLRKKDSEARRILNHALSYYRLGDSERCASILKEGIGEDWPVVELKKAKYLLHEIEAEH